MEWNRKQKNVNKTFEASVENCVEAIQLSLVVYKMLLYCQYKERLD